MKPTQEQVIAWAREAGMDYLQHISEESMKQVEHYTALAYEAGRKDENEACAKVCDEFAVDAFNNEDEFYEKAAAAIRARREQ